MTDKPQHPLRDGAERGNRTGVALVVAACLAVVAGGFVGITRLVADDGQGRPPGSAGTQTARSTTQPSSPEGPLEVSGSGVGTHPFGTDADDVLAVLTTRLGEPDLTLGPQRYFRIAGHDGWFEEVDDPISPSWHYPVASVACWRVLCVIFGGSEAGVLQLRGWELAQYRRWSEFEQMKDLHLPEVRLTGSGIRLGDSWERLHAAYPNTVVGGAEGASLAVHTTPWPGVSDGAAGWRLSGQWDFAHPTRAPESAVVTRLSGGEGPEPGCC